MDFIPLSNQPTQRILSAAAYNPQLSRQTAVAPSLSSAPVQGAGVATDDQADLSERASTQNMNFRELHKGEMDAQSSAQHLTLRTQKPRQEHVAKAAGALPNFRTLPHMPDDIGVAIFDEVGDDLNPINLMTLMNVHNEDNIPPFLTRISWDNKYWKKFSRSANVQPGTNYAQEFVDRYTSMSPEHRSLLKRLWYKQSSGADVLRINEDAQNNFDMVMAAVSHNGEALQYAADAFRNDNDIVMAAVSRHGEALRFAFPSPREDRDVVMAAVTQNGTALVEACAELRGDRDIVMAAVAQNGYAFNDVSRNLQNDREIIKAALSQCGDLLGDLSPALQDDRDIVMTAIRQDRSALLHASAALRGDREFIMAAVSEDGRILEYTDGRFRHDREIVKAAVSQYGDALLIAEHPFQADPELRAIARTFWGG